MITMIIIRIIIMTVYDNNKNENNNCKNIIDIKFITRLVIFKNINLSTVFKTRYIKPAL